MIVDESYNYDLEYDVVVVGFGFAGGVAAIEAHDAGAKVLLVEKMPDPGGISICSHGAICSTRNSGGAFQYLKATNGGRTDEKVLQALADGMMDNESYARKLARLTGGEFMIRERGGNYPFPGADSFYYTQLVKIPNFEAHQVYPQVKGRPGGPMVFYMIQRNVDERHIDVWLDSPVKDLITDAKMKVSGVYIKSSGRECSVKVKRGVILASGGFEANEEMKKQF